MSKDKYDKARRVVLKLIESYWGPRCELKDFEDFPELEGKTEILEGRCPCCLVYERFDAFWELFDPGSDNV